MNVENCAKIIAYIAVAIAVLIFFIFGHDFKLDVVWNDISYGFVISMILFHLFDKWVWRIFPKCLTHKSYIGGQWHGVIEFGVNSIPKEKREVKMNIKQTFSTTKIELKSNESFSYSICSSHNSNDSSITEEILYTYINQPHSNFLANSPMHIGTCSLRYSKEDGKFFLEGNYWTNRLTQGHIKCTKDGK